MATYSDRLSDLSSSIEASASKLEGIKSGRYLQNTKYADDGVTILGTYYVPNIKTYWNSEKKYNTELKNYNSLVSQYQSLYSEAVERNTILTNYAKAGVTFYDIPDFSDENQWRAGGYLKSESEAGGFLFNPTVVNEINTKPGKNDVYHMLMGTLSFALNSGFLEIQRDLKGAEFNLFTDTREAKAYKITATLNGNSSTSKTDYIFIDGGEGNGSVSSQNGSVPTRSATLEELRSMLETQGMNFANMGVGTLLSFAIENLFTGDIEDFGFDLQDFIGASVLGTVNSMISNGFAKGIVGKVGISDLMTANIVGAVLGSIISATLQEFFEVAIGLDASFGYGGEKDKQASKEFGQNAFKESKGFMGLETLGKDISYAVGASDSRTVDYTDIDGNYVGSKYSIDNPAQIGGFGSMPSEYTSYKSMQDAIETMTNSYNFRGDTVELSAFGNNKMQEAVSRALANANRAINNQYQMDIDMSVHTTSIAQTGFATTTETLSYMETPSMVDDWASGVQGASRLGSDYDGLDFGDFSHYSSAIDSLNGGLSTLGEFNALTNTSFEDKSWSDFKADGRFDAGFDSQYGQHQADAQEYGQGLW